MTIIKQALTQVKPHPTRAGFVLVHIDDSLIDKEWFSYKVLGFSDIQPNEPIVLSIAATGNMILNSFEMNEIEAAAAQLDVHPLQGAASAAHALRGLVNMLSARTHALGDEQDRLAEVRDETERFKRS